MTLQDLQDSLNPLLGELDDAIARAGIEGCKVTFVARHPEKPESYLVLGNDDAKAVADKLLGLGATGQFPEGKISPEDAGELRMAIGRDQDHVLVRFGTPVADLALPRAVALALATSIAQHAMELRE